MAKIDPDAPAFSTSRTCAIVRDGDGQTEVSLCGLTVRAYIATELMPGYRKSWSTEAAAEQAVTDADALIAELNKED